MAVAEIGAGSGFLSRLAAHEVGRTGRVVATELNQKMVTYMNERARAEGLPNFTAIIGRVDNAALDDQSMDAIVIVNTYSFFDRPAEMMHSIAESLKPGGMLLIVDFPRSHGEGADPDGVKKVVMAAGFRFIDSTDVVPSHYAMRFRRK